ncbi:MAG: hypothetical protein KGD63_07655 [Candidatus Lokiarchaeota archaeon]|nr:hypothetical protein [Candidatus Lokiarchaeota archaeon]
MRKKHTLLVINIFFVFLLFFAIPKINSINSLNMINTADGPGDVWMSDPGDLEIGEEFTTNLYTNTGDDLCAAYGLTIQFDPTIVQVKLIQNDLPDVEASPDGFYAAGNVDNSIGNLRVSGFDAQGKGPNPELHLLIISWICIGEGQCPIDITVDSLVTPSTATIGTPEGVNSSFIGSESTAPIISSIDAITYEEGATGNFISWSVTDASPDNYTIKRNGTPIENGSYSSSEAITINIDGLTTNSYLYLLEVDDEVGNSNSDSVSVNVLPSVDPIISNSPNISFELGETNNIITWTATDLYPDDYTISRGNTIVSSGSWTSGNAIIYNVDSLSVGIHTIVIEVTDEAGNTVSDIVIVEVTAPPEVNSAPGYDVFILVLSIGITILGILYFKRKRF